MQSVLCERILRYDPEKSSGASPLFEPRQPCRLPGNMVVGVQCVNVSYSRIGLPLGRLLLAVHRAVGLRLIAGHLTTGHLTVHLTTLHHAATALALLAVNHAPKAADARSFSRTITVK